jgi:hypothetical protein
MSSIDWESKDVLPWRRLPRRKSIVGSCGIKYISPTGPIRSVLPRMRPRFCFYSAFGTKPIGLPSVFIVKNEKKGFFIGSGWNPGHRPHSQANPAAPFRRLRRNPGSNTRRIECPARHESQNSGNATSPPGVGTRIGGCAVFPARPDGLPFFDQELRFFRTPFNSSTAAADLSNAAFSASVNLISMISSTPPAPSFTGTPMKSSL